MYRESKNLEFKETLSNSFLKTVSAFSNYREGDILFGVTDDGQEIGIDNPVQFCLSVETKINDSIDPKPSFDITIEANNVVRLHVNEGDNKPYLYKGKAYQRNDSSSVEVDSIELRRLVLEGNHLNFDEIASRQEDYHFTILEEKFKKKFGIEKIDQGFLRTFNLLGSDDRYTVAGELVADKNSFPGIDMSYFGHTINEIKDRAIFEKQSILKSYDQAIEVCKRYYQKEVIDSAYRRMEELIPEEAFREAIANALVHRTWDINAQIRVEMYPDRVKIIAPGGLPYGVTENDYLESDMSIPRNPILADIFFRLDIIERFGTGIKRIKNSYSNSSVRPEFVIKENAIIVTLPVMISGNELSSDETQILSLIQIKGESSTLDLVNQSGFTRSKVLRVLTKLKDKNFIVVTGKGRTTRYRLN